MTEYGRVVMVGVFAMVSAACAGEIKDPASAPGHQAALDACNSSPSSTIPYATQAELESMLLRRWRRCGSAQARGEQVGVEFAADGAWYALARDPAGVVMRRQGIDYGGTWTYYPAGSMNPISREPSSNAFLELDGVFTSPPTFAEHPHQMRILFSPVPSLYVPLDLQGTMRPKS